MTFLFCKKLLIPFMLLWFAGICTADSPESGTPYKHFDLALYGALSTIGKNINLQCELDGGYRFFKYCAVSLSFNAQRRNGLLCSNDFITLSGITQFQKLLIKGGITGGINTIRSGVYREIVPAAGIEFVAVYILTEHLSIRLKERVTGLFMDDNSVMSTSTLLGFGLLF
jgi:hypothetical protein